MYSGWSPRTRYALIQLTQSGGVEPLVGGVELGNQTGQGQQRGGEDQRDHAGHVDLERNVTGAIIILLGLHQMEVLHLQGLYKERRLQLKRKGKNANGYSQAFLLGLTFSFAWTPCVGPVLGSVLALAASGGSGAWQGAGLMLVYTLGLALPFLVLALASSYVLKHFRKLHPYLGTLKKVGGFLIIVMGILVLLGNASILTTLFE